MRYPQGRVPRIEFTTATPLNGPLAGRTTGTVNPGVIWVNRYLQAGVEAIIPIDAHPGRDLGARAGPFGIFPQSLPIRRADVRELSAHRFLFRLLVTPRCDHGNYIATVVYRDMADGQVVLVTTEPLEGGSPVRSVYFVAEQDPEAAKAIIDAMTAPNEKVEAWGRLPEAAVKALGLKRGDFTHG
jgi:hypothetical protein